MACVPARDVIVVAASAGGVWALREFVAALPADLAASVFVVMHIPRTAPSALPQILGRVCALPVGHPVDGERIARGRVYVAPPDQHLLLDDSRVRLSHGPRHNGLRPAADRLFRSAALAYGPRVMAVVLSGTLDDGAEGAAQVMRNGGVVAVQDPDEAAYPGMPCSAIASSHTELVLPVARIAECVAELSRAPTGDDDAEPDTPEPRTGDDGVLPVQELCEESQGPPATVYVCPDCGGPLFDLHERTHRRFGCRVGHRWSVDGLLDRQTTTVENALSKAVRTLEERAALSRRLAAIAGERDSPRSAANFTCMSDDAQRAAEVIRHILDDGDVAGPPPGSGYIALPAAAPYDGVHPPDAARG